VHLPIVLMLAAVVSVQQPPPVRVEVRSGDEPVAGATVAAAGAAATTGADGVAILTLPPGKTGLSVVKDGYLPALVSIDVGGAPDQIVRVDLRPETTHEEAVTVVASTRTGRRVEDQPARVEVLGREEIEEKMLMTPGDIVMMLNEMGGLRVQATSPSLGAASVRIQGMRGRYTRFLSDGLPLFGQQPGGLGLLQIPPMDLGQVEVIKGVASALYGAGAMGGVVNLLSRRPGEAFAAEALVNRSTRGATDGVLWLESPLSDRWGLTLLGSAHAQARTDVDGDGWADLPGYTRGVVRPRLFWDDGEGRSLYVTAGGTWEDRTGGTVRGAVLPATALPYREALTTRRFDAGVVGQSIVAQRFVLSVRGAFARQTHGHELGERIERDRHLTAFAEATIRGAAGAHTWVAGVAVEDDRYRPIDLPQFAYAFTTPAVFVQDDVDVRPWLTISASARLDRHSAYGWFLSPRGSALLRGAGWTARMSAGTGFFGPTPLTEETEAAGLSRLTISGPLRAERGRGITIDLTRDLGPSSITGTFFASRVGDAAHVDRETFTLTNLTTPTTNRGGEILALVRSGPFVVTGTYTYVRARERTDGATADVPLTPRHSAGLVAMVESENTGRLGLEIYVTGRQRLEANPYRSTSEPYVIVGMLAERRLGRVRLFVNGENLTGVRQGNRDPLLRPERAVDGRWTVDAWAPLEGRVVNGGVRVMF
jgi:iron complex outermembrane receptor protein